MYHYLKNSNKDAVYPARESTFSLKGFLSSNLAIELMDATVDTGPVDTAITDDEEAEKDDECIERAYDDFFGTTLLSTAPTTPVPSRPSSPDPAEPARDQKRRRLSPPLLSTQETVPIVNLLDSVDVKLDSSSNPQHNKKSTSTTMTKGIQHSPSTSDNPERSASTSNEIHAVDAQPNSTSKSRHDKRKSKEARKKRRQANPESTHPSASKTFTNHIETAQEYQTEYNVADIPSASTGFIAKPDHKGRVHDLNELLSLGFRLVRWDSR